MYFSVIKPLKIAGKPYLPCICYKCGEDIELTINKLKDEGLAVIHNKKVYFCNGKIIEDKKPKQSKVKAKEEIKGF